MKNLKDYKLFLEELNPNTPQGYLNSLSKKPKLKTNQPNQQSSQNQQSTQQSTTDEVDTILQNTEEQKADIIARKTAIEQGLLNNINQLEPENQDAVKKQVDAYKKQVGEFDKTVDQIDKLNQTIKKSNIPVKPKQYIQRSRQNNF